MMKRIITLMMLLALCLSAVARKAPAEVRFYVSLQGKDTNRGTQSRPWRTLETAAAKVQAYMTKNPGTAVILEFAGGEYSVRDSVCFEGLNSALTLTSAPGQEAVFVGDVTVSGWGKVTDPKASERIPSEALPKVLEADLKACGVEDFGCVDKQKNRPDLYLNGKRQTLSRWPDAGFTNSGRAVGPTDLGDTWIHVHGTQEGILEYKDARIETWMEEDQPYMFGYWYWDWYDEYHSLAAIDKEKKVMTLSEPWNRRYGYRDNCRFYGLNLLCELDHPGEYYIDRKSGKIFWYAPEDFRNGSDEVKFSVFNRDCIISVKDCEDFSIKGITMRGCRNGAVSVSGGKGNLISDCHFSRFGYTVLSITGGYGHKVDGCLLEELGCGGALLDGGDRKTLEASGYEFTNTIVDNFSLFKRTYMPAVLFRGVGLEISHCLFQHSSSSALRLEGNDVNVEYCQFFDLVTESDDQGGIDSYFNYTFRRLVFRYNHWKNIRGGMFAGAAAIRFDDIISGNIVYGNVFEGCGGGHFGGVQINHGRDNYIFNNVFYDCPGAVSGFTGIDDYWKAIIEKNMFRIEEVDGFSEVYCLKYPELKAHAFTPKALNYVIDNIIVGAGFLVREPDQFELRNNTMLNKDAGPLAHFLDNEVQKGYGLSPIPFEKIGLGPNRFASGR